MSLGTLGADLLIVFSLTLCTIVNVVCTALLVKNLHWLWVMKREASLELADYIANKIKRDLTE